MEPFPDAEAQHSPNGDSQKESINSEWKLTKHEFMIMITLSIASLMVSIDATIIITSLSVTSSWIGHLKLHWLISIPDDGSGLRCEHDRRLLDWYLLSSQLCSNHAFHCIYQRHLWSAFLSVFLGIVLHRRLHCLCYRTSYWRPAHRSIHSRCWRRWCHYSHSCHFLWYCPFEISSPTSWNYVSAKKNLSELLSCRWIFWPKCL